MEIPSGPDGVSNRARTPASQREIAAASGVAHQRDELLAPRACRSSLRMRPPMYRDYAEHAVAIWWPTDRCLLDDRCRRSDRSGRVPLHQSNSCSNRSMR
jgi:hypothetical protein